jgi:hypothetical protein
MSIVESVLPVMSVCSMYEVYLTCTLSTNTVDGLRERMTTYRLRDGDKGKE